MRKADLACTTGGSPWARRRAALHGAAGILALTLLACQAAEPYYRTAIGVGAGGSDGMDAGIVPLSDAGADGSDDSGGSTMDSGAEGSLDDANATILVDANAGDVGCGTCAFGVLYWCEGTSANTIRATFSLVNETPAAIPLSEVTIRYWFTGVGGSPWQFACDDGTLAMIPANLDVTGAVTGTFQTVTPPRPGADMYFEVGFAPAAGSLAPRQASLFRTRVFRNDYSTITQNDDYSYTPINTTFGPAPHVTLYRNGMLVDGVEPQPN